MTVSRILAAKGREDGFNSIADIRLARHHDRQRAV